MEKGKNGIIVSVTIVEHRKTSIGGIWYFLMQKIPQKEVSFWG